MNAEPLLKLFEPDDLRPALTTEPPAIGDLVEFWLADGSVGATGRVAEILGAGWAKVRVDGIGNFAVAPGRLTIVARAH